MKEMSLTEHLSELRNRLIKSLLCIIVMFFVVYSQGELIAEFLMTPLRDVLGSHGQIVFLSILDKVWAQFQLSLWASVIFSSPFWFYQLWAFVKPGLYSREIRIIRPFFIVGFFLFWAGVAFGYYGVFPFAFQTLMDFGVKDVSAMISFKDYLTLSIKVLVFLGIMFQLPNLMVILGFMEIATKQSFREMRAYVYVGFAIVAAIITPPDVITQMGVWIPLVCLFEIGIGAVALFVHPYLAKKYS